MTNRRSIHPLLWLAVLAAVAITTFWQSRDDRREPVPAPRPITQPAPDVEAARPEPSPRTEAKDALEGLAREPGELAQLRATLALIERGGPFPHRQDGTVFGNREGRLPDRPRGYYHEYTVPTPGERTRGARRVVRGDSGELYYTRDHYRTFTKIGD